MTNKFAQGLKKTNSNESISITENGAKGFSRTDSRLVDFFFKVGSMRNMSDSEIQTHFAEAYAENPARALELLYMVRDCRGGMGEKSTFLACFSWLIANAPGDANDLLPLIPEYGSWKTFFLLTRELQDKKLLEKTANKIVKDQWLKDIASCQKNGTCSLMAKWMPSENASSKSTKQLAAYWRNVLGLDSRTYRKALSKLRSAIKIVEKDMSAGNWAEIDYNGVPAKAGMIYRDAFLKHDEIRRRKWLKDLVAGKATAKINTTGLTIPEMVAKYMTGGLHGLASKDDPTIEAAWRDLVARNQIPEDSPSMLPVMDGSGSMYSRISSGSNIMAIHVSIGLALFLANINTKAWKGMVMEYGFNPSFFQVPTNASLREQIKIALAHDDCGSTNVEAVFDEVLKTAVREGFKQEEIPEIITFTDGEFDVMYHNPTENLFVGISNKWKSAGYLLPKMYFWNINSRTGTIPLLENELGIGLLSGYSQSIMQMILSRKMNPYQILLEKLDSVRYDPIRNALKG